MLKQFLKENNIFQGIKQISMYLYENLLNKKTHELHLKWAEPFLYKNGENSTKSAEVLY